MKPLRYLISVDGSEHVAQCLDFDLVSRGPNAADAFDKLRDAAELYLDDSAYEDTARWVRVEQGEKSLVSSS